jgi:hypothetical protein
MALSAILREFQRPAWWTRVSSADGVPTTPNTEEGLESLIFDRVTGDVLQWNGVDWIIVRHNGIPMVTDPMLDVANGKVSGHTALNKFGQALDVDSSNPTDVWDGADGSTSTDVWVPPTTARTHDITSTSANDDTGGTGAIDVLISGLDNSWEEQEETVTLNGTANVATANTYLRIFRMQCLTWGSGKENAGIITATAQTDGTVTAAIQAGNNQTLMAIYTVPADKQLLITQYYYGFVGSTPASVTGNVKLLVSTDASVANAGFQLKHIQPAIGGNPTIEHEFKPYFAVGEKRDIKIHMNDCSASDSELTAGFDGILVDA